MVERRIRFAGVVIVACVAFMVGCRGDGDESTPAPSPTATVTSSASPTQTATPTTVSLDAQREEVREAYLAYWDAYAAAVLELDVSLVEDYATGEELEGIRQEIEDYRADGVAARIRVEHDFEVVSVSDTAAVVIDEYVNNSFYVDAKTKLPEDAPGTGEVIRDTVHLEKANGHWVVVRGSRERSD